MTQSHTPYDTESQVPMTQSHTTNIQSTKKQEPRKKEPVDTEQIAQVFDYWNEKRMLLKLRKANQTQKRVSKVRARLNDGFSVEEIRQAIDGCFGSEYHVENGYLDLELICRESAKIEMFIARAKQNRKDLPRESVALYYRECPLCEREKTYKLTMSQYNDLADRDFVCDDCQQQRAAIG